MGLLPCRFKTSNSLLILVRHKIIERYHPREDEPLTSGFLQAAHIEDDEYFSHMIQDDISVIVRDICATTTSLTMRVRPSTTIAEELKQDLAVCRKF